MPHPPQSTKTVSDLSENSGVAAPGAQTCAELIGAMKNAIRVSGDIVSTGIVWAAEEEPVTTASAPRGPARRPSR
jgi:hypothetical protein